MAQRQLLCVPSQQSGAINKLDQKIFPVIVEHLMLNPVLRITDYFVKISRSKGLCFELFFIYSFLNFKQKSLGKLNNLAFSEKV